MRSKIMKTNIDEVAEKVKKEFEYAQKWDRQRAERGDPESTYDKNKPVESWLVYMRFHLNQAFDIAGSTSDKRSVLAEVRKVANLALTCLAHQGCPDRPNDSSIVK